MIPLFYIGSDWALLFLRIAVGCVFLVHGWSKVKNLAGTAGWLESVGFKPGKLWALVVGGLEFGGGILFLAGFLVQPIATLLALQFVVIMAWRLKRKEKLVGGYELDLVLLGALLVLASMGSDAYALDNLFGPMNLFR